MLLRANTEPAALQDARFHRWQDERWAILWLGHLYWPGHAAGEASIAVLGEALRDADLAQVVQHLAGVFGLFVHDKVRGGWTIAGDNAGLYKIYHDAEGAGTSLLELIADRRVPCAALDRAAMIEFLTFGAVLGERSLVAGVRKLQGREILSLVPGNVAPKLRLKTLAASRPGDPQIVIDHFQSLVRSIGSRRLSVDATGGFDSRLVVAALASHDLPFELATSGHPGTPDVEIARRIAAHLGRPFHLAGHGLEDLEEELEATFVAGDGVTDLRRFHRDRQAARARLHRGIELIGHGGGGEFFRDHSFIQDFPRYGSRQINLERFFDLRITPVAMPASQLAPDAQGLLSDLRPRTLARFRDCMAATNNETYDRIYFFLRYPEHFGQHYSNYINMGLDVAAPLLDYDNVMVGIGTSPWRRLFFQWHRSIITRYDPVLAAMPTAEGFSASSEPLRMLADLRGYGVTQLRRVGKKLSQKLTGRARFHVVGAFVADAPGFVARLRGSSSFALALERLKAVDILAPDLDPTALRDLHVGRLLTLGMLVGRTEG
jgi:hypothetical protein